MAGFVLGVECRMALCLLLCQTCTECGNESRAHSVRIWCAGGAHRLF
jgi:hypothetical protein